MGTFLTAETLRKKAESGINIFHRQGAKNAKLKTKEEEEKEPVWRFFPLAIQAGGGGRWRARRIQIKTPPVLSRWRFEFSEA